MLKVKKTLKYVYEEIKDIVEYVIDFWMIFLPLFLVVISVIGIMFVHTYGTTETFVCDVVITEKQMVKDKSAITYMVFFENEDQDLYCHESVGIDTYARLHVGDVVEIKAKKHLLKYAKDYVEVTSFG